MDDRVLKYVNDEWWMLNQCQNEKEWNSNFVEWQVYSTIWGFQNWNIKQCDMWPLGTV
jgi:hypothetical protein